MKQEVGTVSYASKMFESQQERNEMHLRKLGMSDIQLQRKLHLKYSFFFLCQHGLCSEWRTRGMRIKR